MQQEAKECGFCRERDVRKADEIASQSRKKHVIKQRRPQKTTKGDALKTWGGRGGLSQNLNTASLGAKPSIKTAFLEKEDKTLPSLEFEDKDLSFWELFTPGLRGTDWTAKKDWGHFETLHVGPVGFVVYYLFIWTHTKMKRPVYGETELGGPRYIFRLVVALFIMFKTNFIAPLGIPVFRESCPVVILIIAFSVFIRVLVFGLVWDIRFFSPPFNSTSVCPGALAQLPLRTVFFSSPFQCRNFMKVVTCPRCSAKGLSFFPWWENRYSRVSFLDEKINPFRLKLNAYCLGPGVGSVCVLFIGFTRQKGVLLLLVCITGVPTRPLPDSVVFDVEAVSIIILLQPFTCHLGWERGHNGHQNRSGIQHKLQHFTL